ncbi:MAG TPA: hypothetical protein VIV63_04935 [Steroidobacteraceae bacterium]
MRLKISITMLVATFALAGCASWVSVEKVTNDNPKVKGLRYSLSTPYLLMTPKADGTVTYEWLHLPDMSKQYAITKHSMLSTSTLEITLEHGLLKKIVGKHDSTAVATAALGQAGTILAADETAKKTAADAQKTAAKAETEKLKTAVATAQAAQRAADLDFKKAQAKRDFLNDQKPVDDKALADAELEVKMAQIDLNAAEADLARANASLAATGSTNGGANTDDKAQQFLRPLLFRVVQKDGGAVDLQAVNNPAEFPDYSGIASAGGSAGGAAPAAFDCQWDATKKVLVLSAAEEATIVKDRITLNLGAAALAVKATLDPDKAAKSWKITFDKKLAPGKYHMQFPYKVGGADKTGAVDFTVK